MCMEEMKPLDQKEVRVIRMKEGLMQQTQTSGLEPGGVFGCLEQGFLTDGFTEEGECLYANSASGLSRRSNVQGKFRFGDSRTMEQGPGVWP